MDSEYGLPVGWVKQGKSIEKLCLPPSTFCRHGLVTGTTGWGKSGFLLSVMLGVLTKYPQIGVVLVDLKGETAELLRDHFLPSMAEIYPHIRPENICTIAPFSRYGVGLNPLIPIEGLSSEAQSNIVVGLVDLLVSGGLGTRARSILSWLARAVLELHTGSFQDILALLQDSVVRHGIAGRIRDPEVRRYILATFDNEPQASKDSLRARLEYLLLLPQIRGMLCAPNSLPAREIIESPICIVDLGGSPQGFAPIALLVGNLIFQFITAAVFSRQVTPATKPVMLFVDEWQELVRVGAEDFERLLSLARFKKIGLWLANQTISQIQSVSPALVASLTTNVAVQVAFRPNADALKSLMSVLPITGTRVNPNQPDSILTIDQERRLFLDQASKLPPRHALLADLVTGRACVMKTLAVPYDEARARAGRLPASTREAFLRGKYGVPMTELARRPRSSADSSAPGTDLPEAANGLQSPLPDMRSESPNARTQSPVRQPRASRPKLEAE